MIINNIYVIVDDDYDCSLFQGRKSILLTVRNEKLDRLEDFNANFINNFLWCWSTFTGVSSLSKKK